LTATPEVEGIAEEYVVAALRMMHFSIVLPDGGGHGTAVINAWKGKQRVLVKLNIAVSPAEPCSLTPVEEQDLRHQAAQTCGQPWEARVLLNPDLDLVKLEWRPVE
jgi:hypothetical protein